MYKYTPKKKRSTRKTDETSSISTQYSVKSYHSKHEFCDPDTFNLLKIKHAGIVKRYIKYVDTINPLELFFLMPGAAQKPGFKEKKIQINKLLKEKRKIRDELEAVSSEIQDCLVYNLKKRKGKQPLVVVKHKIKSDIPLKFIEIRKQLRLINKTNYTLASREYIEELEDIIDDKELLKREKSLVKSFLNYHKNGL